MNRSHILRWAGIVLGGALALAIVLIGGLYAVGNARLTKHYAVEPESITIPIDAAAIAKGNHLAAAFCAHCHGEHLEGKPLVDEPAVGFLPAPNLTRGTGGAGGEFTDADWVRAIRHGVDPEGRALIAMPSMNYYYLSDTDLAALIAYLKSIPAVHHDMGEPAMSFMGKVVLAAGGFGQDILPAESIDHTGARPEVVVPGTTTAYGGYLVRLGGCRDCHGANFGGGHSPEPGAPHAPDLTPSGAFHHWSKETFVVAVRSMQGHGMPWEQLKPLSDSELEAIYRYLQSLPAK